MRIGFGWDSHEFRSGIPLKIGGVTLPHDKGLAGQVPGGQFDDGERDILVGVTLGRGPVGRVGGARRYRPPGAAVGTGARFGVVE